MVVSVVAAARLVWLVIWATAFWPCTVCLSSDTGGERREAQRALGHNGIERTRDLATAGERIADLLGGATAAAHGDVHDVDLAVDRHRQVVVAEAVGAGRAAQHLAEIDALQVALEVDDQRALGGVEGAAEVHGAAIELAGELGDRA